MWLVRSGSRHDTSHQQVQSCMRQLLFETIEKIPTKGVFVSCVVSSTGGRLDQGLVSITNGNCAWFRVVTLIVMHNHGKSHSWCSPVAQACSGATVMISSARPIFLRMDALLADNSNQALGMVLRSLAHWKSSVGSTRVRCTKSHK